MNIPESVSLLNRALCDVGHSVVELRSPLPDSVPMDGDFHALHVVFDIYYDLIVLADLDAGSGQHSVGGEDSSFYSIG